MCPKRIINDSTTKCINYFHVVFECLINTNLITEHLFQVIVIIAKTEIK